MGGMGMMPNMGMMGMQQVQPGMGGALDARRPVWYGVEACPVSRFRGQTPLQDLKEGSQTKLMICTISFAGTATSGIPSLSMPRGRESRNAARQVWPSDLPSAN